MADTARDIITDSLLDLGVLADEETPSASMAQGALRKLNNMIDAWNLENLLVYGFTPTVVSLTAGKSSYTIGTGGDINIPRPNRIETVTIRDNTLSANQQVDLPVNMLTNTEYAQYPLKGLNGSVYPYAVFIDNGYPLLTMYLLGTPNISRYSIVLWTDGIISNLTLDTVINLAPGYKRALTSNLCIEIAASYGPSAIQVAQNIAPLAQSAKDTLKTQNFQLNQLNIGRGGLYDATINRYI